MFKNSNKGVPLISTAYQYLIKEKQDTELYLGWSILSSPLEYLRAYPVKIPIPNKHYKKELAKKIRDSLLLCAEEEFNIEQILHETIYEYDLDIKKVSRRESKNNIFISCYKLARAYPEHPNIFKNLELILNQKLFSKMGFISTDLKLKGNMKDNYLIKEYNIIQKCTKDAYKKTLRRW